MSRDNFKISFHLGYDSIKDVNNDNEDINIIFESGDIYSGSIITVENIKLLMEHNDYSYFWLPDIFIIKDLKKDTVRNAINSTIKDDTFEQIFIKIGNIEDIYGKISYSEILDMNDTVNTKYIKKNHK